MTHGRRDRTEGMAFKSQTAIRGVFSVGIVHLLARLIAYGKHIVITAYIGLSAQLDAFYIGATVLGIVIFVFGDVFDSLGIPRLVKTLQDEGESRFRELAGSILVFSILLSLALAGILVLIFPWTPWIAPGFSPDKKEYVLQNILFLAPMALLYLPYHAMGSFLRARRRFLVFSLGEILIASTTLLVILIWHDTPYVIPISFSAAYVLVFSCICLVAGKDVRFDSVFRERNMKGMTQTLGYLLPLYMAFHLFTMTDRAFASYLPTGGVSALSYALMIAVIPSSIFMLENIFITPLSEASDKGAMMNRILTGITIVSVPFAFFGACYSDTIVKAALERGVFTEASTRMTGSALGYFAPAIPAFFAWPTCYRLFQILEKLRTVTLLAVGAVLANAILNFLFMRMGFGIKGLALATSLSNYALVTGAILSLRRMGIHAVSTDVPRVLAITLLTSGAALSLTFLAPIGAESTRGIILRGLIFISASAAFLYFIPDRSIRYWRNTVLDEILPGRGEKRR